MVAAFDKEEGKPHDPADRTISRRGRRREASPCSGRQQLNLHML
jgi:hypothetical protein